MKKIAKTGSANFNKHKLDIYTVYKISKFSVVTGINVNTIRDWIHKKLLPAYKLGLRANNNKSNNESIKISGEDILKLAKKSGFFSKRYRKLKKEASKILGLFSKKDKSLYQNEPDFPDLNDDRLPSSIEFLSDQQPFSINEVSKITTLSGDTTRDLINKGILPAYKFGLKSKTVTNNNESIRIYGEDIKELFNRGKIFSKENAKKSKENSSSCPTKKTPRFIDELSPDDILSCKDVSIFTGFSIDSVYDWIIKKILKPSKRVNTSADKIKYEGGYKFTADNIKDLFLMARIKPAK